MPFFLMTTLVAIWLLLNGEFAPLPIAFGIALAVLLAYAIAALRPVRPRIRHLRLFAPLLGTVLLDILRSNLAVARIVLRLYGHRARSGFLDIPLELSDPHGLAILATIVTSTPGTSWAGISPDGRTLRLHVLDLRNEDDWVRAFKHRYERRLMRIFE